MGYLDYLKRMIENIGVDTDWELVKWMLITFGVVFTALAFGLIIGIWLCLFFLPIGVIFLVLFAFFVVTWLNYCVDEL